MAKAVELKGKLLTTMEVITSSTNGLTLAELTKEAGLGSEAEAKRLVARLRQWVRNVDIRKPSSDGRIKAAYRSLAPEVVIVREEGAKAPKGKADGRVTPSPTPAQPAETKVTQATEVVWPKAPELMDMGDMRSGRFEPPDWYPLMKSKLMAHHKHIALKGPPGIGKSRAFEVFAAEELRPLANVGAEAGLRARQLIGGMTDNGRFEVAEFAASVVYGWLAKIDELNGADQDALLALNGLLAPPYQINIHGKMYPVHPEWRLCVTYNPGLTGTKPLPESLKDRFYPIPVPFPTEPRLNKMLIANDVDTKMPDVQLMIKFAMAIAKEREERHIKFDITMRRLLDAWSDLKDGHPLYTALRQSVVGSIDDNLDIQKVSKILDDMIARKTVAPVVKP